MGKNSAKRKRRSKGGNAATDQNSQAKQPTVLDETQDEVSDITPEPESLASSLVETAPTDPSENSMSPETVGADLDEAFGLAENNTEIETSQQTLRQSPEPQSAQSPIQDQDVQVQNVHDQDDQDVQVQNVQVQDVQVQNDQVQDVQVHVQNNQVQDVQDVQVQDVQDVQEPTPTGPQEIHDGDSPKTPEIPAKSIVRSVSISDMVITDATRQQVVHAKPVVLSPEQIKEVSVDLDDVDDVDHADHADHADVISTAQEHVPRVHSIKEVILPSSPPPKDDNLIVGVCVVGFHHTRGPEVEYWVGPRPDQSATWPYLPFQSLPDGSHQFEENVVYFTLLYDQKTHTAPNPTFARDEEGHIDKGSSDYRNVVTLFAIACSRQTTLDGLTHSAEEEYTRPTVHKSVVVIARKPIFGPIREKLTVVTRSYFNQRNFSDRSIIDHLYQNLEHLFSKPLDDGDLQVGINLRDFVYKFGTQALVLFKALLLEKKVLFYASDTEVLCTTQFALISLIPNLLNHLEDCGSPLLSSYETHLKKQTHLKASDRESLLTFMGLPLQVFAAGGMFSPFVPLQHLDELRQKEMQYGLVGTTNNLFLSSGIDFDITVDIDSCKIELNPDLKAALQLSQADKQFMEPIFQAVRQGWNDNNRWEPRSLGYQGSEDYIRHQFEDYVMALTASAKYDTYLDRHPNAATPAGPPREFPSHPLKEFNPQWSERWRRTNNYRIFDKYTDEELFDIVDPVHVGLANHDHSRMGRLLDLFRRPHQHLIHRDLKEPRDTRDSRSSSTLTLNTSDMSTTAASSPSPKSPRISKLAFWKT